jgi:hypothetical protein
MIRLRILLALAALGWFGWIAYRVSFEDGFVFLAGVLCVALLLANFSRFRPVVRWSAVAVLVAANAVGGFAFVEGSLMQQAARADLVRGILNHAGRIVTRYHKDTGKLPDCSWKCVSEELEKAGYWEPEVPYLEGKKSTVKHLAHIPPRDPWGCRYVYALLPGKAGFELSSSGPDRRFGTNDDIIVDFRVTPFGMRADPGPPAK